MQTKLLKLFLTLIISAMFAGTPFDSLVTPSHAACDDEAGPSVNWQNCRKRNLIMGGFNFSDANFTRADLSASDLRKSNLSNVSFVKTNLVRASLAGSLAQNANFESVIASRTDFSKGIYLNANFSKAEITRSNFSNSDLEGSTLSKADFSRVNFFKANMKSVDLSFSNIARANLNEISFDENFKLEGAFMFLTRIESLDLSKLNNLKQWQIDMACGNDNTILPDGLTRPSSWPCSFDSNE